jgi:hypothetical protein
LKGTHPGAILARFGLISSNSNCSYMVRSSLTYIPGFSVKFFVSRFITIMQIRHILIKDHI